MVAKKKGLVSILSYQQSCPKRLARQLSNELPILFCILWSYSRVLESGRLEYLGCVYADPYMSQGGYANVSD